MSRRTTGPVLLVAALLAAPAPAPAEAPATGRLLVSLERDRPAAARAAARDVLARAAARRAGPSVPAIGLVTVKPAAGVSPRATARLLRADPRVRAVEVERRATPRARPADPALSEPETTVGTPAGTPVAWWVERTGLFEAWGVARGTDAEVAVIDTGADGRHPELAPKIRGELDLDPTRDAGGALVDERGHGTHVASLACAATGDGRGIAGAGHDCGLLVVKTDFSDASVAQGIVAAADRGVEAINLAFGTDGTRPPPTALVDALRYAADRGAVVVAAAADERTEEQGDPANVVQPTGTGPDLGHGTGLTVTAATHADEPAPFAGRGTQISLAAYGTFAGAGGRGPRGLLGAWPGAPTTFERGELGPPPLAPCGCRRAFHGDDRYAYVQGTSMATAIVSGVAALVGALNPDLAPADVVRLLKETARRPAGAGHRPDLGWGILDAAAAVRAARRLDRRAPESRLRVDVGVRRNRFTGRRSVVLAWTGADPAPPAVDASGVARYELWRAANGRRAVRVLRTRRSKAGTRVRPGRRYAFFTVAVDRAGNREPPPARPDVTVRVARR